MRARSPLSGSSWIWRCLVLCCWVWPLWLQAQVSSAELVKGPEVVTVASNRVEIRWTTNVECGTRLIFGPSPERMSQRSGTGTAVQHAVTLDGLQPGDRHFFTVGTAQRWFVTNSFLVGEASVATATPAPNSPTTNAEASPESPRPPPANRTWGDLDTLQDHFDRHGPDFDARSPEEYAAMAWAFRQQAIRENWRVKRDDRSTVRIFDPRTGAFGAYRSDGRTRTFFKPNSPAYFARQPGEWMNARDLPR